MKKTILVLLTQSIHGKHNRFGMIFIIKSNDAKVIHEKEGVRKF